MQSPLELLDRVSKSLEDVRRIDPIQKYPRAEVLLSWFRDRKKSIRDPIYDQITLNELERAVLRTPEFQRLRWVRQMDFAYMVYPAAEHSRFVHSLGVCQAGKELFDRVVSNHDDGIIQSPSSAERRSERRSVPDFCLFDRVLVSLAALLHDLAHPAFSHAFDTRDDMVKHDDYEHNPFMLRALFDTKTSELAKVLVKWDPYFQVLVRAEAPQLFPESAHVENVAVPKLPCLATLVFEILAIPAIDDLGLPYKCICPSTSKEECTSIQLESIAREGWGQASVPHSTVKVHTSDFFRRLHCDIVANTISADLLDYIRRDTRLAGLPRDLDRRFYSYISSAEYRGKQRVVVELQDRQGHVRRDALSDLMNCMETRYIIHERIVLHRAVVGARSMAARLYPPMNSMSVSAIVDKMYGPWGTWRSDAELLSKTNSETDLNSDVATLLRNRRLYRPVVIIDAERLRRHNVTLPDEAKQRLALKFGAVGNGGIQEWPKLVSLENEINQKVLADVGEQTAAHIKDLIGNAPISFAACMRPSVLFKNPRILVRVPTGLSQPITDRRSQVEVLESWLSQVIPLNAHEGDQGLYDQISALSTRYRELWRLYIFCHPLLFESNVGQVLLSKVKIEWEDAIRIEAAIPQTPPNVSADDLRGQDVIDRLEDQQVSEILTLALNLFPSIGLLEAEKAVQRSSIGLEATYGRLQKLKEELGSSGVAAKIKGKPRSTGSDEAMREFESFLKGTPDAAPHIHRDLFDRAGGADGIDSSK